MPSAVPNGISSRLKQPRTMASIRAQGCRSSNPQPATIPTTAPASNRPPNPLITPCTKPETPGEKNGNPNRKIDTRNKPGIRRNAEIASQNIPSRRTWPAIRLSAGIKGTAPAPLPQLGQKRWNCCIAVPQRSQYILVPPGSPYEGAARFVQKLDNGRRHMRSRGHASIDRLDGSDVLGNGGAAAGELRHQPHHADSAGRRLGSREPASSGGSSLRQSDVVGGRPGHARDVGGRSVGSERRGDVSGESG